MLGLVPAINSGNVVAQIGDASAPVFSDLLPYALLITGILLGLFLIKYLVSLFTDRNHK